MVQELGSPHDNPTGHQADLFPTRFATQDSAQYPPHLAGSVIQPWVPVRTHLIRQVVVLEVACGLGDIVDELDRAIQLALAEGPRGVVCDLSAMLDAEPGLVEVLATAGRHVRDWPGIPVAVACPDPRVREVLRAHPLGGHLILAASLFSAVSAVLATPTMALQQVRLAPHATAPRVARDFVTRTLLDWRLGRVIPFASLVVGELVASSTVHTGTEVDVSVAWNLGALRLMVRDQGPRLPGQAPSAGSLRGRGLTVVAGLSRAFGVLPTASGGKVVWAVLEAARPRGSSVRARLEQTAPTQGSPVFTDAFRLAELPFCGGSRPNPNGAGRTENAVPASSDGKAKV
jgi:hypothetical protein